MTRLRPHGVAARRDRAHSSRAIAVLGEPNAAAARMGIHRTTLISRMKKQGINPKQYAA